MNGPMGPISQRTICPQCKQTIETEIEPKTTTKTHVLALILCIIGCCPCSGCLYCTVCARDTEHYCPACKAYLGVYER